MTYESKLPVSVSEVLNNARTIAFQISAHASRLSVASGRRITARSATKLRQLADEVQRIDIERERGALGSIEPLIREGQQLITAIAMAARFAAVANPTIGRQLENVRRDNGRSRHAMKMALHNHAALVKENAKVLAPILPKTILKDIERVRTALSAHHDVTGEKRRARADVSKRRAELIREIRAIVGETRALAAALFRNEPEIARQFQAPKRRPSRAPRKPRAAEPAPQPT